MRPLSLNLNRRGFTLLECVVAIAVLGLSIMSGLELMGTQAAAAGDNSLSIKAVSALSKELEHVRATKFTALTTTPLHAHVHYSEYMTRRTVSTVNDSMKEVVIEIQWTTSRGDVVSENVTTFCCEDAPQ